MGHPSSSVIVGIPTASSDGKFYSRYPAGNKPSASAVPIKLISRGLSAFADTGTASLVNSSDYSQPWQGSAVPGHATVNISSIVGAIVADSLGRKPAIINLTNGFIKFYSSTTGETGNLTDYTIDLNAAASAGSEPTSGWVNAVTITGNIFAHKAHLVDVAGYNWVRVRSTATNAPTFKLDIFDASNSANAAFTAVRAGHLLIGDSITAWGMANDPQGLPGNPASPGDEINAIVGTYTPFVHNAGMPGWDTTTGTYGWLTVDGSLSRFENAVAQFPGLFVHVPLGTNDANNNVGSAFYTNLVTMKDICAAHEKIMVVPTIPYSTNSVVNANRAVLDQAVIDIANNFPGVVLVGEDRYAYGAAHPTQMGDTLHPDGDGYVGLRALFASRAAAFGAGA